MSEQNLQEKPIELKDTGYEIVSEMIGEGGYGKVYMVRKIRGGNRIYAGKFVNISDKKGEAFKQKLMDTTKNEYILGKMLHTFCGDTYVGMVDLFPNIYINDTRRELKGIYYLIIMEYLEGMDLTKWLDDEIKKGDKYFQSIKNYRYRVALGYCLAITIGNALKCMHANGYMHNDIKPDNIFMSLKENNSPIFKIFDFGLSCEAVDNPYTEPLCKNAGKVCANTKASGTFVTAAPEILSGCKRNFIKSESWSLGVTLYTLIFGEYPEEDERFAENMETLKSRFSSMWFMLINLIEINTRKRWSMDELLNYASNDPEIKKSLRSFNLEC